MNNKQKLLQYLKSQKLMSLSTCSDKPYACIVFYTISSDFTLYFVSQPDTQHCQNIAKDPSVACSIVASSQHVTDKKVGVQIQGNATLIHDEAKAREALTLWNKANPGFEKFINLENMRKNIIKSKIYQIKPISIKFFNEVLYGTEGLELFKF